MGIGVERLGIVEERSAMRGFLDRFRYRPANLSEHAATRIDVDLATGERRIEKLAAEAVDLLSDDELRKRIERRRDKLVNEIIERQVLKAAVRRIDEMGEQPPNTHSISDIIAVAAAVTGAPASEIVGASRQRRYTHPRFFACWLIKTLRADLSLPAIGLAIGNRDHTTIMHALREFERQRETPQFVAWLNDPRTRDLLGQS